MLAVTAKSSADYKGSQEKRVKFRKVSTRSLNRRHSSLFYNHAFPKREVIFDVLRGLFRIRIVPCRVLVHFSVDDDVVITRRALPRADRVGVARLETFFVDRVRREIVIAFDDDGFVTFGDYCAVPNRFHNFFSMKILNGSSE